MDNENVVERCFWCGHLKDKSITDEDVSNKHLQAVIRDYVPCDACKDVFSHGIHVIGVTDHPIIEGMFPISHDEKAGDLYPTGAMFVANEQFVYGLFTDESEKEQRDRVLKERVLMLPNEFVENLVREAEEQDSQSGNMDEYLNQLDEQEIEDYDEDYEDDEDEDDEDGEP